MGEGESLRLVLFHPLFYRSDQRLSSCLLSECAKRTTYANKARQAIIYPPRLVSSPQALLLPSRRLRMALAVGAPPPIGLSLASARGVVADGITGGSGIARRISRAQTRFDGPRPLMMGRTDPASTHQHAGPKQVGPAASVRRQ